MFTLRKLGLALGTERKWTEAESVHREALAISRKKGNDDAEALVDLERLVRVLMAQKKFGEAEQLLGEALTPAFVRQPSSVNLLVQRVNLEGRRGQWDQTAADAALVVELQPNDHYRYHTLAGLLAITGDRPAYEQLCKRLVGKFANTTDAFVAERVAQDCLLLPDSGVDLQMLDNLADTAVTVGGSDRSLPYFQGCKAMSKYRLGHFAEAIEWAEKAIKTEKVEAPAKAKALAASAMAHWQLGRKDEARAMLAEGDALAPGISSAGEATDLGESWVAWVIARISLDEAATLMQAGSRTNKTSNQ
jgi:tetratricopeptide (TPR) repeat protein